MEILITGGNGFVGRHMVRALQERGDMVRVLALPTEDASWLESRNVRLYRGDISRPDSLVAPMEGVGGVLHLAAMMDVWRPLDDYRAVNVAGTENVCRAALAGGARRLVHMSSSSVYGMALGRPVDESFPLRPFRDPYPITKAEGDQVVQRMIKEDGLPAVIMRPDQIFGPGDRLHFGQMADRVRTGKGIIVGSGRNMMPFVFITDVVQALLLGLDHPRAAGQTYNVTNDEPLTQQQIMEAVAADIGAEPPRLHVPYLWLYAVGWAGEQIAGRMRSWRRPPATRLGVAFFGTDNRHSIAKARGELGYSPRVALREGLKLTADWYLKLSDTPTSTSRYADRSAREAR